MYTHAQACTCPGRTTWSTSPRAGLSLPISANVSITLYYIISYHASVHYSIV